MVDGQEDFNSGVVEDRDRRVCLLTIIGLDMMGVLMLPVTVGIGEFFMWINKDSLPGFSLPSDFLLLNLFTEKVLVLIFGVKVDSKVLFCCLLLGDSS